MSPDENSSARQTGSTRLSALLVGLTAAYFGLFAVFPQAFFFVGINHFGVWFLDSFALLASNDAVTRGLDPYGLNPLDYFQRPHVYSPWWLHLRNLGLTRADNLGVGLVIVTAFFAAAPWRLRPRTTGELGWMLAVLCASPVLLAVNRANNDLIIFALLTPVVPCIQSSRRWMRLLAVALLAVGAGLKYYPAAGALLLLAGGDRREVRGLVVFAVVALGLVAAGVGPTYLRMAPTLPKAEGLMTFGATNLLEAWGLHGRAATLVGLAAGALIVVAFLRWRGFSNWTIAPEHRGAWLNFILGAVLLTGCFFTGTNYAYRWVFAIWLAPFLWQRWHDATTPRPVRALARMTALLLLIALWADAAASAAVGGLIGRIPGPTVVRSADIFFLCEQPLTWALFACLLGFLAHFTREGLRGWRRQPVS